MGKKEFPWDALAPELLIGFYFVGAGVSQVEGNTRWGTENCSVPLGLDLGTYRMRTGRNMPFREAATQSRKISHPAGTGPGGVTCRALQKHFTILAAVKLASCWGLSSCPGMSYKLCILFLIRSSSLHRADLINSLPPFQESLNRVSQKVSIWVRISITGL